MIIIIDRVSEELNIAKVVLMYYLCMVMLSNLQVQAIKAVVDNMMIYIHHLQAY